MYSAVTRDIAVTVTPFYMEERSDPAEGRYVWGYRITIDNQSDEHVKLLSRYWVITDGTGHVEEVSGPASSATSPISIPATATSIRRAARFRRRRASWSAATRCATSAASCSTSRYRRSRWTCRARNGR